MPATPLLVLAIMTTGLAAPAGLAQETKIPQVGLVGPTVGQCDNKAFGEGMRDLGYKEGGNLVIDRRLGWG